jgi:hypothetical protein
MSSLSAVQKSLFESLIGSAPSDASLFAATPAGFEAALAVHRDTIFGGVANALRICFPTIDRLVGAAFFDRACQAYMRETPPASADLIGYARGFVDFLATYAPAQSLPYLGDVARFDLLLDRAARGAVKCRSFALDAHTTLTLVASLAPLSLTYPADEIRAALDMGDEDALTRIDMAPAPRWFAVWRSASGVSVRRLSAPAGVFLHALLETNDIAAAANAAAHTADPASAANAIQSEVFIAPFATLSLETEQ